MFDLNTSDDYVNNKDSFEHYMTLRNILDNSPTGQWQSLC